MDDKFSLKRLIFANVAGSIGILIIIAECLGDWIPADLRFLLWVVACAAIAAALLSFAKIKNATAIVTSLIVFALIFVTTALICSVVLPSKIGRFVVWFRLGPFFEYASVSMLISGTLAFAAAAFSFRFVLRVYREIETAEPLPPSDENLPTPPPASLE